MHFYYDEFGKYEIESRKDLGNSPHKERLKCAARKHHRFRCGCRDDIELWLIPVELSGDRYILRRLRRSDPHLEECFTVTLEAIFDNAEVVYTERMLMGDDGRHGSATGGGEPGRSGGSGGPCYEDLCHFFQAQFTRATLDAFGAANAGKSFTDRELVNPNRSAVFKRLGEIFYEPLLCHKTRSLAAALKEISHEFFWGVVDADLVALSEDAIAEDRDLELETGRHWDCRGFQPNRTTLKISPEVLEESRGKVKAMTYTIPGPYLYAALVNPIGEEDRVKWFYRVPISYPAKSDYIIESAAERRSVNIAVAAGIAILKLHTKGDFRGLGKDLWPFRTDEQGHLPSRPDLVAFFDGLVRLIYLTDTAQAQYHAGLKEDIETMRTFLQAPEVGVHSVPASLLTVANCKVLFKDGPPNKESQTST
jgi:hypothetical protein